MGFRNIFSSFRGEGAQPDPSELSNSDAQKSPDQVGAVHSLSETEPYSDFSARMDQVSIPKDPIELAHNTDELSGQVDQFQDSLDSDSHKKGAFGRWGSKKGGSVGFISKLFSRDKKKIEPQPSLSDASAENVDDLVYPTESDEATLGEQTEDKDNEDDREERSERNTYLHDGDDVFIVTEENIKELRNLAAFDTAGSYDKKEEEKFLTWLKKREKSSGLSKMMKDHYGYLKQTLIENNKKIDAEYQQLESQSTPDCSIYKNYDQMFSLVYSDPNQPKGFSEKMFTSWTEAKQAFLMRKEEKKRQQEEDQRELSILQGQNTDEVSIHFSGDQYQVVCPNDLEGGALFEFIFNGFGAAKEFFQEQRAKHSIARKPLVDNTSLHSLLFPTASEVRSQEPAPLPPIQSGFSSRGGGERGPRGVDQEIADVKADFLPNFLIKKTGIDLFEVVSPTHYDNHSKSFVGGGNTKKFTDVLEAKRYFLKEKQRLIDLGLSFNKKDPFDFAA